ncbi:heavy-metal-associated domain-containing protein [Clostridium tyrobutyricum]|jgi:Cu2+-exporting ATPase|uniref:heavy-metal-associated domain-containing protein n=1 Tax=Clostridium tyrobutyricum TaxID=1519 RepID=UPI0002E65B3F|nr:heavy metal-associated domain-containing protein [Clostridium tyrobutyricum]MBV4425887.1 heavy-metal-associated domain-containing protein [Clostridium tyrobutyricum]MEA5008928.1 heavy metal-associated domain-containing protein [Clostridium tyrobutyricum]
MFFGSKIKKTVHVEGMTCQHCVHHVKKSLEGINGVSSVKVDLNSKTAVIKSSNDIDDDLIKTAVKDAGYEVTKIE